MRSVFLDFVRLIAAGTAAKVSRHLAANPALATMRSEVGATRQEASAFFLAEIAHYLYGWGHWWPLRTGRNSASRPWRSTSVFRYTVPGLGYLSVLNSLSTVGSDPMLRLWRLSENRRYGRAAVAGLALGVVAKWPGAPQPRASEGLFSHET